MSQSFIPKPDNGPHSALAGLGVLSSECAIDTADHVKHGPTGETWLVGYVRGDKLAACGWPDTLANLSDCTLVKKATDAERMSLLQQMAKSTGHRASYARERLAAAGVPEGGNDAK